MLNDDQIKAIETEIKRLKDRKTELEQTGNAPPDVYPYLDGKIDALEWAKGNL